MWAPVAFTPNSSWFHAGKSSTASPTRSNGKGRKDSRTEQTNSSLSVAQIISSAKVKVDLIFSLVLIKQLLHYLISHNQVKGGGE